MHSPLLVFTHSVPHVLPVCRYSPHTPHHALSPSPLTLTHAPIPCLFTLCLNHIQSRLSTPDHIAHTCLTPHAHLPHTQCMQALGLRTVMLSTLTFSLYSMHTHPMPCTLIPYLVPAPIPHALRTCPTPYTQHTPCTLTPAMHAHLCTAFSPCSGTRVPHTHAHCAHSPMSNTHSPMPRTIAPHPVPSPTLGALSR